MTTGAELSEDAVRIRVDDTQAPNERVVIHVEHPSHPEGVRAFYRNKNRMDVERCIRSHIRSELRDERIRTVEVTDTAHAGVTEQGVLPEYMQYTRHTPTVEVKA